MIRSLLLLLLLFGFAGGVAAQAPPAAAGPSLHLTLDDAVAIALERNFAVRTAALEASAAHAQVREAWGQVLPEVSASGSFARNVVSPNPFAGSEAGGIFGALGALDWLAHNERARTDGDPATGPLTPEEFRRRQAAAYAEAGLVRPVGGNPFGVPNQFQSAFTITQPLYSGPAFAAIRGAQSLREISQAALVQEQHRVVHETRALFYAALLAEEQAAVAHAAVRRAGETHREAARLVAAGTLPVLDRLTAEVEVTNLETQLLQAEHHAAAARSMLLFHLGLPVDAPLRLQGTLAPAGEGLLEPVSLADAVSLAMERRPEIAQARLAVKLNEVNREISRAAGQPVVSAFASLGYFGNVPDMRTVGIPGRDPGDPFAIQVEERGFFDSGYWNPSVAVGARISWAVFDGFRARYRLQQRSLEVEQARVALERVIQTVVMEIDAAQRSLVSAQARMAAQRENVGRAEMAYGFASARLANGVASQLDVRMASAQLDQARLGYLQAVYDFLVAQSDLQRATGLGLPEPLRQTRPTLTTAAD